MSQRDGKTLLIQRSIGNCSNNLDKHVKNNVVSEYEGLLKINNQRLVNCLGAEKKLLIAYYKFSIFSY